MGSTRERLSVEFDPPSAGGITLRVASAAGELTEDFSHIYPLLPELCSALWEAGRGIPARPVTFYLEPAELELRLHHGPSEQCRLVLQLFRGRGPQHRRQDPPHAYGSDSTGGSRLLARPFAASRPLCLQPRSSANGAAPISRPRNGFAHPRHRVVERSQEFGILTRSSRSALAALASSGGRR